MSELSSHMDHVYIDKELSANLDSTCAFEGPEKLLEIWFYPNEESIPNGGKGLRSISVEDWCSMLKLVNCEVLSIKKTKKIDAFLLSESSMFVFDHKLTLKTCGTTTTLSCLEKLFDIVKVQLSWDLLDPELKKFRPYKVFYSRRCFMFPANQRSIHKSWSNEVACLNKFFCCGVSYLIGRIDQNNHWNLYVTETNKGLETFDSSSEMDETLEILMTGLDHNKAQQFVYSRNSTTEPADQENNGTNPTGHLMGLATNKSTQLNQIYDNITGVSCAEDAFAFTPCGYSSNMVVDEKYYYTLHVTPEKGWSYASFESNVPVESLSGGKMNHYDVLKQVLEVFEPAEFSITLLAKRPLSKDLLKLTSLFDNVAAYHKCDKIIHELDDYQSIYLRYRQAI
ncbi:adenosylmethionine decarboxylase SPE2 Ecym_7421 [Eremothecium cymbalariae DBVPG|uniref:S-adenosylmethionine decarboxylase proenzyme n=1 Tax=Eremothecium cymbalariae (strain CBS 270.75 / DBVPG 7215 / KCTC 17166 / NRRL Y-17582) TaxID=931890 RepID=G8JWM9_ERECY|nr:hypothetical protein Ecym_7421 [Eremothecium cymbalariae DBVPG\